MIAAATNVQVAQAIGMTHSGVSRIRSGDRLPSVEKMVEIAAALGWSVEDQVKARTEGKYAEQFEAILAKKYGVANDVIDLPSGA